MELDDGSVLRLASDALFEFSDYTRLSTGSELGSIHRSRRGYFTGDRSGAIGDSGRTRRASHRAHRHPLRLEARDNSSQISVLEGKVRFSCRLPKWTSPRRDGAGGKRQPLAIFPLSRNRTAR